MVSGGLKTSMSWEAHLRKEEVRAQGIKVPRKGQPSVSNTRGHTVLTS